MTLRDLKQTYTRMQKKYYAGLGLPPVKELKFRWASREDSILVLRAELACVSWDGDNWILEFHPILKQAWLYRLATLVLLHEMAHLRNPKADHGPWFHEEATRLGSLGAMREFWV